jgi:diguanylate cyclase (GGDEF)-like protein
MNTARPKTPAESLSFRQSLLEILEAGAAREERLIEEFERRKGPGDPLYSPILYILTHLNFTERQAARHWRKIVEHRERLRGRLRRDPGLRVAILDYFLNVSHELKNPKVIEISIYERTERSAVTDGLTGLYNHAYLLQGLRQELLRAKRHDLRVALLLLDLDDFKHVNDLRGHVEGDRVLMRTAAIIRDCVREIDVAARYGGEEFAVLLPETSRLGAFVVAERIRRRVEERFRRGRAAVTVSGGIATFPEDAGTPAELIVQADAGLYRAKAEGKNRITLAGPQGERRRHQRAAARHGATLATGEGKAAARVKNISDGGLLVTLRRPVAVGSRVSLHIQAQGATPMDLSGEVVHVERVPGETEAAFDVGVRFLETQSGAVAPPRPSARA